MSERVPLVPYAYSLPDTRHQEAIRMMDIGNILSRRCAIKSVKLKPRYRMSETGIVEVLYWPN